MLFMFLKLTLAWIVAQVSNPAPPAAPETPPAPVAPTTPPAAAAGVTQDEHNRVLVDNAILNARIKYPQVPEELLRKFKGEKPDDWLSFADFAAKSIPAVPPAPASSAAPAPATPQASGAAAPTVPPSGGEPVPAPGVGSTVSSQAATEMRLKDLKQKVVRKTATQEEAQELADVTLIRAFNKHMKERKLRA